MLATIGLVLGFKSSATRRRPTASR